MQLFPQGVIRPEFILHTPPRKYLYFHWLHIINYYRVTITLDFLIFYTLGARLFLASWHPRPFPENLVVVARKKTIMVKIQMDLGARTEPGCIPLTSYFTALMCLRSVQGVLRLLPYVSWDWPLALECYITCSPNWIPFTSRFPFKHGPLNKKAHCKPRKTQPFLVSGD